MAVLNQQYMLAPIDLLNKVESYTSPFIKCVLSIVDHVLQQKPVHGRYLIPSLKSDFFKQNNFSVPTRISCVSFILDNFAKDFKVNKRRQRYLTADSELFQINVAKLPRRLLDTDVPRSRLRLFLRACCYMYNNDIRDNKIVLNNSRYAEPQEKALRELVYPVIDGYTLYNALETLESFDVIKFKRLEFAHHEITLKKTDLYYSEKFAIPREA